MISTTEIIRFSNEILFSSVKVCRQGDNFRENEAFVGKTIFCRRNVISSLQTYFADEYIYVIDKNYIIADENKFLSAKENICLQNIIFVGKK